MSNRTFRLISSGTSPTCPRFIGASWGKSGMSLTELLVAITVLGILSGAIAAVMISQIKTSITQQNLATSQSDVGVALNIMQWDMMHAGLGCTSTDIPIPTFGMPGTPRTVGVIIVDGAVDSLSLVGAEASTQSQRWTIKLKDPTANTDVPSYTFKARYWADDTMKNPQINDLVVITTLMKSYKGQDSIIGVDSTRPSDSTRYYKLASTSPYKAVQWNDGDIITSVSRQTGTGSSGMARYTYLPATQQLLRNGVPFLENVECFQVTNFWDTDFDGIIDTVNERYDQNLQANISLQWTQRPLVVGMGMMIASATAEPKIVDNRANITLWNNTYALTPNMKRRYRNLYTIYSRPRNIGI